MKDEYASPVWGEDASPVWGNTQYWNTGWKDPLEKEMATHSSILAWKISRSEEPGRLQPMGSQRVGHAWATVHTHTQCAYPVWRTYAREVERSFHILPGALYAKLCVYIHVCKRVCVCMCMCMHAVGTNLLAYTRKDLFSIFLNSKLLFAHSMWDANIILVANFLLISFVSRVASFPLDYFFSDYFLTSG